MMFSDRRISAWAKDIGTLLEWQDRGYTFYKMMPMIYCPSQTYFTKYKQLFGIENSDDVLRCLVFLEDKKRGYLFEIDQTA